MRRDGAPSGRPPGGTRPLSHPPVAAIAAFDPQTAWHNAGEPPDGPGLTPVPDDGDDWTPPDVLTARQVCDLEPPDNLPILSAPERGPLAYPGVRIVIGAPSGAGKTTFSLRVIRAAVLGEKFLDWRGQPRPDGQPRRALIVDLEQGLRTVQRRLREAGLDECEQVDYVRIPDGLGIDRDERQREWLRMVLEQGGYDLVLVDPLYKLHHGDGDERGIVDLMRHLDRWREDYGFCLILPAHLRKADKTGRNEVTMDDISGSGAIVRGAEIVLGLRLVAGIPEGTDGWGKSQLYFWKDRDGDLPVGTKWNLTFRPEQGYMVNRQPAQTTKELVAQLLAAAFPEGLSYADMARSLQLSERTVSRAVGELKTEFEVGEVTADNGKKLYRLAEVVDLDEEGWT